jgi:hypothetical protein
MRAKPNRPINDDEIRIIRTTLERCGQIPEAVGLVPTLDNLHVVDGCQCGCASVDFAVTTPEQRQPIADGLGILPNGERVGVIVWGTPDSVTGLEIYDMSATATGLPLSKLQSVIPWEEGAA